MTIHFRVIQTVGSPINVNERHFCGSDQIIPDISGDGIPDIMFVIAKSPSRCETEDNYEMMQIVLYRGVKDMANKRRGLPQLGVVPPLQEVFSIPAKQREINGQQIEKGGRATYPVMILQPTIQDYNGDGVFDISFLIYEWTTTSGLDVYKQVILFGEKATDVK